MNPLETYLQELRDIRSTGAAVKETSYYGALERLFNNLGKDLKPKVRCVIQLKNRGAGMPDGGLFTARQFQRQSGNEPVNPENPERGVIEIKGTGDDAWVIADTKQVSKYWERYGQVLVTNYRDFLLIGRDAKGQPVKLETYCFAENEADFWAKAANPRKVTEEQGEQFTEYLKRVMLHAATITSPQDVAWFLASYARDAKARIEKTDLPTLANVREALEEALGISFNDEKGERFFKSTLIQTLFYGIFSAWVLWHKQGEQGKFDWRTAAWYLRVPMIVALFGNVATPQNLGRLDLVEVLDWTGNALNRVDRESFFSKFDEGQAVQYFYEPFLQAFDPELRKELGVWYTPPEIVQYMVARVDTVLREELGIEDGLANENVYILDPCCGTGAYLVEVIKRIHATLQEKGMDSLVGFDLKKAAINRVFGFELLTAPFVVAHLQLGLLLQNLGVPLVDEKERVGVYLTNALTGWESPQELKQMLLFPELEEERDAAEKVKREKPILVILGNPPYYGFAGVAVGEERDLSNAYRTTVKAPAPEGQGLNELYVRFFRMAERRIVEQTGKGIICFISNYSWLEGKSHPGMRERFLDAFDQIWIDCLNGDKYATGKMTPEGEPDPSIFSTEWNREGIQLGTAITLLMRKEKSNSTNKIKFRNLWGKTKKYQLLETALQEGKSFYQTVLPPLELGFPFKPSDFKDIFFKCPSLTEIFPISFPGVQTKVDELVIDIDREQLIHRMEQYFNPKNSHEEMGRICLSAIKRSSQFDAFAIRDYLLKRGFLPEYVVRYCYRPFDYRWIYWEPETNLLGRKSPDYFTQVFTENIWIEARAKQAKEYFDRGYFTRILSDNFGNGFSNYFPLYLKKERSLFNQENLEKLYPNLSDKAGNYLISIDATEQDIFYHTIAILHDSAYREENAGALRQAWARIPLPDKREALIASAELGRRVAALLDPESSVTGVTSGKIRPELQVIARISRVEGKWKQDQDFELTAGWGHAGQNNVTMPGRGRLTERQYAPEEQNAMGEVIHHLGKNTYDIYLNDIAYWKNIPARVWDYTIGGYQVIKKWLSYREKPLLGRPLKVEEVREVTNIARRITAILLLETALDTNYEKVKQSTYTWPK